MKKIDIDGNEWGHWYLTYTDNECHARYEGQYTDELYVDYTYDHQGRLIACNYELYGQQNFHSGSYSVVYDNYGQIINVNGKSYGSTYDMSVEYHANGRVSKITYISDVNITIYEFDELGRMTSMLGDGYNNRIGYVYGDGLLPVALSDADNQALTSTESTVSVTNQYEQTTTTIEVEFAEIETPVDVVPILGIWAGNYAYPNQYGNPWIRSYVIPFGVPEILQTNELWLAQNADKTTAYAGGGPGGQGADTAQGTYECGQMSDGTYALVGTVWTHQEKNANNEMVDVVSIVLDEPVDYTFKYRGNPNSTGTAYEVALANSKTDDYDKWRAYAGKHIAVGCEGLQMAYYDASLLNVDAFAIGNIWLLE